MLALPSFRRTLRPDMTSNSTMKLHPLCVEEVLSVLFEYSSFSDLKKYRCVCRSWEKEARHRLLTETAKWKLAPIVLAKEKDAAKFLNIVEKQIIFFEFSSIYIVNYVYDHRKTVKTSKFVRFLNIHGHYIKELQLKNLVIRGNHVELMAFFINLQRLCPNLEKLFLSSLTLKNDSSSKQLMDTQSSADTKPFLHLQSLTIIQPSHSKEVTNAKTFDEAIRSLFKVTPNLVDFMYYSRSEDCNQILQLLIDGILEKKLEKLQHIHLDTQRGDLYDLQQFQALGKLKLRCFQVGIDTHGLNPDLAEQELSNFLLAQQHILTVLQICFNVCDISRWHSFFKVPTLPCLQELNIPYQIFSFAMLKLLPNLRKLTLRGNPKSTCWIEETDNYTIPAALTGSSVTKCLDYWIVESGSYTFKNTLHLRCEFVLDETTVKFFAKKFTKVYALEFGYLSEDVLLTVYEHFPDLQHLSIVCPAALYVSSRAYLGESKTIALTESRLSGFKLDVETRNRVADKIGNSANPSILCLKKLKRLELIRFGSLTSINRIHHSIECSSGFMFGISALQNVTELKLHPFIHKRAVMSLRLMPALRVLWTVPLIIGSRETGGRSDYPTTAYWYQVLLRKRSDIKIYVTTAPTNRERELGVVGTATRLLHVSDVYRGNATSSGLFVYLDEYYVYQDGCEVPKLERIDSSTPSCAVV